MECCLGLWKLAKPRTRCLSTRVEQNKEHRKSIILINLIWVVSCSLKLCFWQHTSVNFVGLDWSGGSNTIDYPRASANCLIAGRAIAYFFHKLRQGGYRGIFSAWCNMLWYDFGRRNDLRRAEFGISRLFLRCQVYKKWIRIHSRSCNRLGWSSGRF